MEWINGLCCCFLAATFLSVFIVQTSQGQQQQAIQFATEPDTRYYAAKKHPANVTCEAYGASRITFTCMGSQIPVSSQKTYETFDETRRQNLVRSSIQVSRSDVASVKEGTDFWCTCSAEDDNNVITSRRAVISQPFLKKRFKEEPLNQTVEKGSLVVFTCIPPLGDPAPEISWLKDRKKVDTDNDGHYIIGSDGSLTIVTARAQDAGIFECIAMNKAGRRSSKAATLTIENVTKKDDWNAYEQSTIATEDTAKPRNERDTNGPVFNEEPEENIYVTPTANVTLVCDVKGAQMMTFQCNDRRVNADKLQTSQDRAAEHIRSVLNLTYAEVENYLNTYPGDEYTCECVAWYMDPKSSIPAWASQTSRKATIYLAYLDTVFADPPSDVIGQVGSAVRMTCKPPEGKPSPWVYWIFNQQRLDPRVNTRYSVDSDGSLTINTLDYTDEGRYYCVAENSMGIRQSNIGYLTVSEEPVIPSTSPATTTTMDDTKYEPTFPAIIPESPVFTRDLSIDNYLDENGEITLICTVVSADQLTFRCNNERLMEDEQVISIVTSRETSKRMLTASTVVTYDDLAMSQLDEYSCQCVAWFIENQNWQYLVSKSAIIRAPFIDNMFAYEPQSDVFNVGDTAEFACGPPAGEPKPKVMWHKDGVMIDPNLDSNFIIPEDGVLIVEEVRVKDAGEYVCVATNSAGARSSKTAYLELYNVPSSTSGDVDMGGEGQNPDTSTYYDDSIDRMITTTQSQDVVTSADYGSIIPFFTEIPDEKVYIIQDQPAILKCAVVEATTLFFVCNEERILKDKELDVFKMIDPGTGYTMVGKSIHIDKKELENYEGSEPYTCHCRAYYRDDEMEDWQYVAADNTSIHVAYLRKQFIQEPLAQTVELGASTELSCQPPIGEPEPLVYWLKDGFRVTENNYIRVAAEGSLIFEQINESDAGDYTCVAENVLKTRFSNTVSLTVMEKGAGKPEAGEDTDVDLGAKGEADGESESESEGKPEKGTAEGEEGVPKFVTQPESSYYIIKSRPVTITCQASWAETITFNCNMDSIPQSRVQFQDLLVDGKDDIMTASVEISREEVENYNNQRGGNDFYCQCFVRYTVPSLSDPKFLPSSKGYVQVAYLKKFKREPPTTFVVNEGEDVSLPCEAPEGNPAPEVHLMFNGERIHQDFSGPDSAFVIRQVSSLNAGTYVCVATNIANTRSSPPAVIKVKVGDTVVTGSAPKRDFTPEIGGESTFEYEDGLTTGTTEKNNKCVQLLNSCGAFMPGTHSDTENGCQNAPRYVTCVEEFVRKCRGMIEESSVEAAEKFKMMIEEKCSSPQKAVCKELMECQHDYAQQSSPADSSVVVLCTGIHAFLLCAENAVKICNIPQDNPQTSLKDLANWFQQYCMRVVDEGWAEDCSRVSECNVPIEQTTNLLNLVQTSLWCPQLHDMMQCTSEAVTSCGLDNTEEDLRTLARGASDTCPRMAESEGEDDDDAADKNVIDGGDETGPNIDENREQNSAWSLRASVLLMSLLPVVFVFMACR